MSTKTRKPRLTKKDRERIEELFSALPPIKGEQRTVYRCRSCKTLWGHRYVPYGLGRGGPIVGKCLCALLQGFNSDTIESRTP